jgi:eukaryotic-like serine/threonine-protein kinase
VQLALTEMPEAGPAPAPPPSARAERLTTALLGTADRSLRVAVTIPAPPARVLEALGRVVTASPYELQLVDTVGGHPLDGGVMQFHRPLSMMKVASELGVNMFAYRLHQLELDDLRITLRPVGADRAATEVVVYGDLRPGMRKNLVASHWMGGGSGVLAGVAGWFAALSPKLLALDATLAPLVALGGLAVGAASSYAGFRLSYRGALKGTEQELREMLEAVGRSLRAQQVFGVAPPPPAPPRPRSDGDDAFLLSGL